MKRTFIAVLLLSLFVSACNTANNPPANQAAPQPNQAAPQTQRVPQTAPQQTKNLDAQAKAEHLVKIASQVRGVNDATAVVLGRWAVVGIDVKAPMDRPEVGVIKYSVAEALKQDPMGARAVVTADVDIVQRLREMAEDIRQGRPVAGFAEELADITGRIMPQLPRDVQQREQPNTKINQEKKSKNSNAKPEGNRKIPVNR